MAPRLSLSLSLSLPRPSSPIFFTQLGRARDPVKYYLASEQRARERQVAYETVRLLREDVIECYRREGVNHYENCKDVNQKYYDLITKKDLGQLQPKWEDPAKSDGW
jgi:NADH-ubiquinone oxidoreductase subunit 10